MESQDRKSFVISDTHFYHANIIKYSHRPFADVREMNSKIVENWNRVVGAKDKVYFLGDFGFGKESLSILHSLNGDIMFIHGNHDSAIENHVPMYEEAMITYDGIQFMLIHNPDRIPKRYKGWVIAGHHHNNYPNDLPFFNPETKIINVSVEMINYAPVDMRDIVNLVKTCTTKVTYCESNKQV